MHTMKPLFVASIAALLSLNAQAQSLTRPGTPASTQSVNTAPAQFLPNAIITEGFDTVSGAAGSPLCTLAANLTAAGWFAKNNAAPPGTDCVFNGGAGTTPPAQSGVATSYAAINFRSSTGAGDTSTWFVTPRVNFGTGATLEFWTRGIAGNTFPDRLEVRLSTAADAGTPDVGATLTSTGTFTTLLLSINPTVVAASGTCPATPFTAAGGTITGYPLANWCKITISGAALPSTGSGRVAFRYNTPSAGPDGLNGNFIGIDTFSFDEGAAGPVSTFTAVTPPGNITLARTLPATTSTSALVFNVTGANSALTCATSSAGYSVAPAPLNLVAGTPGTVTVTHTGSTAGSFPGVVTCTGAVGSTGGPFVYNFTTNVSAQPTPITATTASGSTVGLLGYLVGGGNSNSSSTTLSFNIPSGTTAQLSCAVSGNGYTVGQPPQTTPILLNLVGGTPGTVTVTYTGSAPGTFPGGLICTPVAPATGGPFAYTFSTVVGSPALPVPTLGNISLMLLIAGFLGLGMVLVGRRQA